MVVACIMVGIFVIAILVTLVTLISLLLPIVLESLQEAKDIIEEWKGE